MPNFQDLARSTEGQRRKLCWRKEAGSIHVIGGTELSFHLPGQVCNDDICAALVLLPSHDIEEIGDLDYQPGFLQTFTCRGLGRALIKVDEPTWECPQPLTRLHSPPDEKDLAFSLDDHTGSNLMLTEDDLVTYRTEVAHASKSHPIFECVTTTGAVVQFRGTRQVSVLSKGLQMQHSCFQMGHKAHPTPHASSAKPWPGRRARHALPAMLEL